MRFVDAAFWIALLAPRDKHHPELNIHDRHLDHPACMKRLASELP